MSLSVTHFDVAALIFEAKITGWVRSASSAWLCFNSRAQLAVLQKKQMNWGKNDRHEEGAPKNALF